MPDFTWSFSSLKEYINCPRQYHECRVLQGREKKVSQQMIYGTEVHKALEDYVELGTPLAKNYEQFKAVVDELIAIPGTKYPEYKMALYRDKAPCGFDDANRWVRGIVDLLIVDGSNAFIVDYKTGSDRFADTKQLRLMALMAFANFPEVTNVKAGLLFLLRGTFIAEEYDREDIDSSWEHFTLPLARIQNSFDTDTWVPNPTPLCRFCPVNECEFHRS